MCKKLYFLISLVFVLGLFLTNTAEALDPDLVGLWMLDDGSGPTAADSSGNGNHGTLVGDPQWVPGKLNGALEFDGTGDWVDCGGDTSLDIRDAITIACWIKVASFTKTWETILSKGDNAYRLSRGGGTGDSIHFGCNGTSADPPYFNASTIVTDNEWHHVAGTYDGANMIIYIDGDEDGRYATTGQINIETENFWIGNNSQNTDRELTGLIDDVRIYRRALTETEIEEIMLGEDVYVARNPSPADGASNVSVETNVTWTRGDTAKWDKVYFGTDPCDVNLPEVDVIEAGPPALYDPGDPNLRASTTYYWYITEVNGTNEHKGPLWSFTTVSGKAQCEYPIHGTVISGDPYFPDPENYTYTEMTFLMGVTAVKHTGYFSADRDEVVDRVPDANLGSPPRAGMGYGERYERLYYAGRPDFPPYESLIRGQVYYWTVDETDAFGNFYPGDIWWFAVQPYYAFEPSPPNEAIYIDPDVLLSWLEGYGAQGHDVFIGTSWEDVNNAYFVYPVPNSSPEYVGTTGPGDTSWQCSGLPTDTKIYWRVDEIVWRDPPEVGEIQKGHVWEFTTRGPIPGLAGEYYHWDGGIARGGGDPGPIDPFQSKVLVRVDPNIDFAWAKPL